MTPSESNPNCLNCRLRGASAIREAAEAARSFGATQMLDNDEIARLSVVVEELVANLYDHGGLTDADQVELSFMVDPDGIRVTISDHGKPFDPWSTPRKQLQLERGGGVGIDLIRAWAELVEYQSSDEGNRLEFLLPIRWDS